MVGGRMRAETVGPYLVVDDSYNANSASMQAAIETLAQQLRGNPVEPASWRCSGEMRELGTFCQEGEHRRVGDVGRPTWRGGAGAFGPEARAAR